MPFRRFYSLVVGSIALVPLLLLAQFPKRHAWPLFVAKSPEDPALISRIQALSPSVSLDDAKKVAYCAVTTGQELARLWNVKGLATMMPGIQNWLVKRGARQGGYCFQYSAEVLRRLEALELKTVEFHWAETNPGTIAENNAIVVTAIGQPFEQGVLLDSWRSQPNLTWTQVRLDPEYHQWKENKAYAAFVLQNPYQSRGIRRAVPRSRR